MGFFGGLWSAAKTAVKTVGSAIATGVKKTAGWVKEKTTNMWNKFTGKSTFEEAEELYDEISERYNRKRQSFDKDIDRVIASIESRVNNINTAKAKIKNELFVEMAGSLEKIKDIKFSRDFSIEAYKQEVYSFDSISAKNSLYKIDFNKHKFKTSVQAIFTLGFYTRKKARETLYAVQEEECKINAEIAKMDAELIKVCAIDKALKNVEEYFDDLIKIYEQLLVRLDNSVHYLYFRCMHFAHKLVNREMSIKVLPRIQQKELEAIITTSKILKVMTENQILSLEEQGDIQKYQKYMKNSYNQIIEVYKAS